MGEIRQMVLFRAGDDGVSGVGRWTIPRAGIVCPREERVERDDMATGFFWDERCFWHGGGHYAMTLPVGPFVQPLVAGGLPEGPEAKRRIKNLMDVSGLSSELRLSGAPAADTGAEGDLYLDTTASAYYGPKLDGDWGTATSLIGPQGPPGMDGGGGGYYYHSYTHVRKSGLVAIPVVYTPGATNFQVTATAYCYPHETMLGGGYTTHGPDGGVTVSVSASYPNGDGWSVTAWNEYDDQGAVEAYVLCEDNMY